MVNSAGAVALNIRVPADWAWTGSFPADVAAQQQHVHDLPNRVDGMLLLGYAEAPGDDRGLGLPVDFSQCADLRLRHTGLPLQFVPRHGLNERPIHIKSACVTVNELSVNGGRIRSRGFEQMFRNASHEC